MRQFVNYKHIFYFFANVFKKIRLTYRIRSEKRKYGSYQLPYSNKHNGESINILANGPSLKKEIKQLKINGFNGAANAVVNFFALSDDFTILKPEYYLLADSEFFKDENKATNYGKVFDLLNSIVDWEMILILPFKFRLKAIELLHNNNIKIKCVSQLMYGGNEKKRFDSWKRGDTVPSYVNVVLMAEYFFLQKGFSKLYLYGVDHTFLQNLAIDNENNLCIADTHFYGTQKYQIKIFKQNSNEIWKMSDFVFDKYLTFKEHELIQQYSVFLGAQVFNCTECSMIDAYPRLKTIN